MICDSGNEVTDYYITAIEPGGVMSFFVEGGIKPGRTNSVIVYPFTKMPIPAS